MRAQPGLQNRARTLPAPCDISIAMTPFAKRSLVACGITAVVESILTLTVAEPVLLPFVIGPMAFLAVLTWRRRTHLSRSQRLATVAIGVGALGIAAFGVACYQRQAIAQPDQPSIAPLVVPLVQWIAILVVWLALSREESREKREKPPVSP